MGRLTANEVKAALETPGTYQDGDGLFLKVAKGKGASWVVRIQHEGQRRDYYLGSAKQVTLAKARAKAAEHRTAVRIERRNLAAEKRGEKAAAVTFRQAAKALHESYKAKWH